MSVRSLLLGVLLVLALGGCSPRPSEPVVLKVMTFNIRHGEGMDKVLGLHRAAAVIKESGADIVLLQEVDSGTSRTGAVDQPEALAQQTGLPHYAFGKNLDLRGGGYGNAILSRYPITKVTNHLIPQPRGLKAEQRGILQAEVNVHGVRHHVFNTHYGLTAMERQESSAFLLSLIQQVKGPVIFGGDLNTNDFAGEITLLNEQLTDSFVAAGQKLAPTFPANRPTARIDYIFFRAPYQVTQFQVMDTQVSDHRPVLVELSEQQSTAQSR